MSTAATGGFTEASFESFLASRNEPDWSIERRRTAWRTFQSLDWPRANDEEWMRTDIRLFKADRFAPPAAASSDDLDVPPSELTGLDPAGRLVSFNSRTVDVSLDPPIAQQGVRWSSLDEALLHDADTVRPRLLQSGFDTTADRFAALHGACWSGGAFLHVPRNVRVARPFHLMSALGQGGADFSHLLVVLEPGAEATLVCETLHANVGSGFHCGGVELVIGAGAVLRFVTFQNWNQKVWHFARQHATLDADASLEWTVGALGSRLAKVNQTVRLDQPGAECRVNGALFTQHRQHLAYHTLQHHRAPRCRSDFLYKAALQDQSRTVWRGMIRVDEAAQQTDGYQRNDNLMLSSEARADSIPGLEIEADDVRCTHGSTTGSVDEELLFYAMSRGFTRREAVRLIVTGFFQHVFDRVTIDTVRNGLAAAIGRRVREYD